MFGSFGWLELIILAVIPFFLGFITRGIIKKFVIAGLDLASQLLFVFFVIAGGGIGVAAGDVIRESGTGLVVGALGGVVVGTMIFGVVFLFLAMHNYLQTIASNSEVIIRSLQQNERGQT